MASLTNAGTTRNPKWRIRYRNRGEPNPRCFTMPPGSGKRDGERLLREIQLTIDTTGRWDRAETPPVDLAAAIDQYIQERGRATRRGRAAKESTRRLYGIVLRNLFLPYAAGRGTTASLHALEAGTVGRFLDAQAAAGKSESTVYTYGANLRAFWRWAHRRWPDHVAAPQVDVASPVAGVVHAPTIADIDCMIATLDAPVRGRNRHPTAVLRACIVMRHTGLRISQAGGLRWGDLGEDADGRGPSLHIRPDNTKTRAEAALDRRIPIPRAFHRTLLAWRLADGRPADGAPIVGPGLPRDAHDTVRRAWKRAEIDPIKWRRRPDHAIRRGLMTYLAERGVPDPAIDWFVGHAPRSINARHYTSQSLAWWSLLLPALESLPDMGTDGKATSTRRLRSSLTT